MLCGFGCYAVLDSGTSLVVGPPNDVIKLVETIGANMTGKYTCVQYLPSETKRDSIDKKQLIHYNLAKILQYYMARSY